MDTSPSLESGLYGNRDVPANALSLHSPLLRNRVSWLGLAGNIEVVSHTPPAYHTWFEPIAPFALICVKPESLDPVLIVLRIEVVGQVIATALWHLVSNPHHLLTYF
jgi:hypothetical protein